MKNYLSVIKKFLIILVVLNITMTAQAYRVEITPANPNQGRYVMKINEEAEFTAKAYVSEDKDNIEQSLPIEKIFWQFDYTQIEKVTSGENSIKIRARREGKANLTVTGIVENFPFTKTIEIAIEK